MGIDWSRLGKKRDEAKEAGKGGTLWKIEVGETKAFVHGQCYPDDDFEATMGLNFVETWMHYPKGRKKGGGHVCLDAMTNPVILHPLVKKFLSERKKNAFGVSAKTRCPTCEGIRAGNIPAEHAAQRKWLVGLTPMFYRHDSDADWMAKKFDPKVHVAGNQVFNGLADAMVELARYRDITDPSSVTLLKIIREGESFGNTNYDVKADIETTLQPTKLDKGQRRIIQEAMKPGGSCDLFKVLANLMKSPEQILSAGKGVDADEDAGGGDGVDRKECYGVDWSDDDECAACADTDSCREACRLMERGTETVDASESPPYDAEAEVAAGEQESDEDGMTPECYGSWERANAECLACVICADCEKETYPDEVPHKPVTIPNRPPPAKPATTAKALQTQGKHKPAPLLPPEGSDDDQDDPDFAAIEAEARKIAGRRQKSPATRR